MKKVFSLTVGINDYPGSNADLQGCVNDANAWHNLFRITSDGGEHFMLLNEQATKARVKLMLETLVDKARFGDRIFWQYSGHGSRVPDQDGDEHDRMDECLVLHDWQYGGILTDDEIHEIFVKRRRGVRVYIFSDSCNSGTVARAFDPDAWDKQARYFPAELLTPGIDLRKTRRGKELKSRTGTMLMSGCRDDESSWDAYIDGYYQGAFSWAALTTWRPDQNMRTWHAKLKEQIEGKFFQTPQLNASEWQKRWKL